MIDISVPLATKIFTIHAAMKQRCYNPRNAAYKNYGARGIVVCEQWRNDRERFAKWAFNNGYDHGLWLERKNNNGNYEPGNCAFVEPYIQARNRRKAAKCQ